MISTTREISLMWKLRKLKFQKRRKRLVERRRKKKIRAAGILKELGKTDFTLPKQMKTCN